MDVGAPLTVAGGNVHLLSGKPGKIAIPIYGFPKAFRGQVGYGLEDLQLPGHHVLHFRPGGSPGADHADVGVLVICNDVLDVAGQSPLARGVKPTDKLRVPGYRLGGVPGSQEGNQGFQHRVGQKTAENCQGLESEIEFCQLHTFRIAPFAPLETRAA